MLISVAICTYQRYPALIRCLDALRRQSVAPALREILVMDNSPDPSGSQRALAELEPLPGLRWYHLDRPGLAHARNRAIEQCQAPLLAFLDDDTTPEPGWLAALIDGFSRFGTAAHSAGGPVRPAWPAPPPPWLGEAFWPFLSLVDRGAERRLLAHDEWIPGANTAYRLDRLRAAGGFRERLGRLGGDAMLLSNEDTEAIDRLHRAGGQTAWLPGAGVDHHIDASRLDRAWFRRRFAWQAVSDAMLQPQRDRDAQRESWRVTQSYLDHMNTHMNQPGLAALAAAPERADLSHWQMSAIYHLVLTLLAGLDVAGESGAPGHG